MRLLWVALRKELMEQWRSYRLLVTAVVLVAFGMMSPLFAKYTPEMLKLLPQGEAIAQLIPTPTIADAVAQYLKNLSQFGVVLALLMAMGAVAQEKDKGTAAMMLAKPMPRGAFLGAKFAALAGTFAVGIALAGLGCYFYTLLLFGALDLPRWMALNGLVLLYMLVYVALTLFASTLTRSQTAAGGLAFGLLMLLALPGAVPRLGEYLPGQLVAWGGALMAGSAATYWPALCISAGLIVVPLVAAWLIFERQEL